MDLDNPYDTPAMKEVRLRKQEIEEKLAEDLRKRDVIKSNLDKADRLKEQMVHTLDQFVDRLKKLEDTIIPVHRQTKDLQWLQENVERTKTALDDDISYHQVAQKVCNMVQLILCCLQKYVVV